LRDRSPSWAQGPRAERAARAWSVRAQWFTHHAEPEPVEGEDVPPEYAALVPNSLEDNLDLPVVLPLELSAPFEITKCDLKSSTSSVVS